MYVANVPALNCICVKNSEKNQKYLPQKNRKVSYCYIHAFVYSDLFCFLTASLISLVLPKPGWFWLSVLLIKNISAFALANTAFHRKEFILYDLESSAYFSTLCISMLFFPPETYRFLFLSQILVFHHCIFNKIAWWQYSLRIFSLCTGKPHGTKGC